MAVEAVKKITASMILNKDGRRFLILKNAQRIHNGHILQKTYPAINDTIKPHRPFITNSLPNIIKYELIGQTVAIALNSNASITAVKETIKPFAMKGFIFC